MKTIGVIGFGFVGQAIYDGMKHAFNVKWYDKNWNWSVHEKYEKLGDYCDSLEDLLLHVTGRFLSASQLRCKKMVRVTHL